MQNTFQPVGTLGLFREKDGVFPVHYGETLATVKTTTRIRAADHAWLRYGFNGTSQPAGVARCGRSRRGATTATVFTRLTAPTPASSARTPPMRWRCNTRRF